ncbi:MAG TPA: SusE domain-containing protein [Chitinophagaceae bacterium]|nr:SusE domain-containing protein [Chitinophagaceae bacterium]
MKNKLSVLLSSFLLLVLFSCKKEENKIYYEGGTAPSLTASATNVTLEPGQENNTALVLNWTNPEYQFTTGVSSHDVTYTLELDTSGANFGSSVKYTTVISNELSKKFTVAELNGILGNTMLLQLNPRRNYTIQARITSTIGSAAKLTSNIISFTAKPFSPPPKVEPPANGTLWATGNAFASDWSNPLPSPYDVDQMFTQVSPTLYEATVDMVGGGGYKLIQIQGDWGTQYHMTTGTWDGGDFEKRDSDPQFPGPPSAGRYKITVNFQLGKYTVVKL